MTPHLLRKQETRARIIATAARLFLEKGLDRVGVDEIMRECGLTHGGFYCYFRSKEALVSQAYTAALDATAEPWAQLARKLSEDRSWKRFRNTILAGRPASVNNPAWPAAMLGADVARRKEIGQSGYATGLNALIDSIAEASGSDRRRAVFMFAALVGATSLAAQCGPQKRLAAELLDTTRDALLRRGAPGGPSEKDGLEEATAG